MFWKIQLKKSIEIEKFQLKESFEFLANTWMELFLSILTFNVQALLK